MAESQNLHETQLGKATVGTYSEKVEPTAFVFLTDIHAPFTSSNLRIIFNQNPWPSAYIYATF